MAYTFESHAGDNDVKLELTLTDGTGALQPLLGSETCQFIATNWKGVAVVTKAGIVSDAAGSKVAAVLDAADTVGLSGQVLRLRVPVTFASGAVETFPTEPDEMLWSIT